MLNERIDPNSIVGSGRVTRYLFAALSTSFIGAGLVRFAYTPLLPVGTGSHAGHKPVTELSVITSFNSLRGCAIDRCSGPFFKHIRPLALLDVIIGLAVVLATGCSSTGEGFKAGFIAPTAEERPYDPAEPGFSPTTVSRYSTDDLRALGLESPESSH